MTSSAPSSNPPRQEKRDKTLDDLEWGRVVRAVAARCMGPLSENLQALPFARDYEQAATVLREVAEAYRLNELNEPLPLEGIRDIDEALSRVERGGSLSGHELSAIAKTVGAGRVLSRFLSRNTETAPHLKKACATDPSLVDLKETIERAVDTDGTLADHASPLLGKLRSEVSHLRSRIVSKLEQMLLKHSDIVQDRFLTLREDRYVLPVRTDAHEKIQGIVHGTSGSGATVFVEPRAIVGQGNRLKMAQSELEREEARILALLSDEVRGRAHSIHATIESLNRADLRNAAARLAKDLGGCIPELEREPLLDLQNARHPLLVLDGVDVVASDLQIESGHGLVLSGPNAGGKTVSLKVLGLAALMVRAGLPLVADEGSRAGFFGLVLTDVGDEQSLTKNLSTFSAHITNLIAILKRANAASLILLDEVATGTDPKEGAALAAALVDAFCESGAAVAVTTHYEDVKALALTDSRLTNASVGFDVEKMEPTFEVRTGVPGQSSALRVARRFGMPEGVLTKAQASLSEESRSFEQLVDALQRKHDALDSERAEIEELRHDAETLHERAEQALQKARRRDEELVQKERKRLTAELRDARKELRAARKAIRAAKEEGSLEAIRDKLTQVAAHAHEDKEEAAPAPPRPETPALNESEVAIGDRAFIPRLQTEVVVVEAPHRGRVRVAAGPVKLWVKVDELRQASAASRTTPASPSPAKKRPAKKAVRSSDNTLDIRGMRVEDALGMLESFLDRMFGNSENVAYIVHGVGSGALKSAVAEHLTRLEQYVASGRPAELEEGGAGVTVITLR